MNALASCSGGQASVAIIHLTPTEGVIIVLATLVVGYLVAEFLHRWLEHGDELIAEALKAAEDESLAIAEQVTAPYTASSGQIPAQRVSNGEDMLEDFGSDR